MPAGRRLTAEDWTAAAVEAIAAGGIGAVAVEPLAARLGATKGSFYWHFRTRDALVDAALARWERTQTERVIERVEREPDARERLRALLTIALDARGDGAVELALQATATHPLVAPVLHRVTRRRLAYLTDVLAGLGVPQPQQRGLFAYTAYLGHVQLAHATPGLAPTGAALTRYVDLVTTLLTAP